MHLQVRTPALRVASMLYTQSNTRRDQTEAIRSFPEGDPAHLRLHAHVHSEQLGAPGHDVQLSHAAHPKFWRARMEWPPQGVEVVHPG